MHIKSESEYELEMWTNAQRDGRPAEHRLVSSTPQSLADAHYYVCRAVKLPRHETR